MDGVPRGDQGPRIKGSQGKAPFPPHLLLLLLLVQTPAPIWTHVELDLSTLGKADSEFQTNKSK